MKLSFITAALEEYAPLSLQESWDNSGLQVGLPAEADGEVTGALLCVDVTEDIITDAVRRGRNLVISHHPLIFKGLKHITGSTVAECAVAAAIRSGVAVYSSHTALDSTRGGVSYEMARMLGARVVRALAPAPAELLRLSVVCPSQAADDVQLVMLDNGAQKCCVSAVAESSANAESDGITMNIDTTSVCRISAVLGTAACRKVREALTTLPASASLTFEISALRNDDVTTGLGVVAEFDTPHTGAELLAKVKKEFNVPCVKAGGIFEPDSRIRRIALCGGAGGEFIPSAAAAGAQLYISADIRYHDFAENALSPMAVFDIGHFESESCAKRIFYSVIKNKFANFAVDYSETEHNPVKYL